MRKAFAPNFEFDIFFSYSSRDDQKQSGQPGRVSKFIELLSECLARMLKTHAIWMDRIGMDGQFKLTEGIERPLKSSAVMLAFLSRMYHESDWCPWERQVFLNCREAALEHFIVVEFDQLKDEWRPSELKDNRAHRFWEQGALDKYPLMYDPYDKEKDAKYRTWIDWLARDIVKVLEEIEKKHLTELKKKQLEEIKRKQPEEIKETDASPDAPPVPVEPDVKTRAAAPPQVVYLAETTDDLDEQWRTVKAELERRGVVVVPKGLLPRDPMGFKSAVEESVSKVDLFVQLLSTVPGRKLPDEEHTYPSKQHQCALDAKRPVLQRRPETLKDDVDLDVVKDPIHRRLLDGPDVQAEPLGEFTKNVLKKLERLRKDEEERKALQDKKDALTSGRAKDKYIFVVADKKDKSLASKVFDFLNQQGFPCGLPVTLEETDTPPAPPEVREDYERNVLLADGTVVVYGQSPPTWYRNQLVEVRKLQAQSQHAKLGLYVQPVKPILFNLPRLYKILADADINAEAFKPFLDAVANNHAKPQPVP